MIRKETRRRPCRATEGQEPGLSLGAARSTQQDPLPLSSLTRARCPAPPRPAPPQTSSSGALCGRASSRIPLGFVPGSIFQVAVRCGGGGGAGDQA